MRNGLMCLGLTVLLSLPWSGSAQALEGVDPESPMLQEMRDFYGDEAFITIATGSRKPIYKAPAVATVITAAEIKAMGARNLDEVLETVAGLHVVPSTQGRLDSIYSIRGIHTSFNPQVLVLMNGIPFPHFSGGRPFHFRLPVNAIARVEVIRGPGSAVYGADAFGGVINIITKDASDIQGTEIGGRAGSFDTQDLWLQHGKRYGEWDFAYSLEWQKSAGDRDRRIAADQQTIIDNRFNTNASLAPGALSTRYDVLDTHLNLSRDNWQLRYWLWRQQDAGLGAGSALALDPVGEESLTQHLVDLTYSTADLVADWDFRLNAHYLHRDSESRFVAFPPGAILPIGSDGNLSFSETANSVLFTEGMIGKPVGEEDGGGIDFAAVYTGMTDHRWRIGAGVKSFRFKLEKEEKNFGPGVIDGTRPVVDGTLTNITNTEFVFLRDASRTVWYLSLQDEWQFVPNWELTAGVRYDHYSDFGDTVNPRLALVWATRHDLTAKILYGRAFRAPSFSEQFSINNPVGLGNPDLDPETIDTLELSFDYRPTFDLQTNLSVFAYRARDLIEFVADPGGTTRTAQNARDQDGYGFELEMDWRALDTLRLQGYYAWQRSKDVETKQRIADAPGQMVYLAAKWEFLPEWEICPQYRWIGSRKRAISDPRGVIDNYSLVDVIIRKNRIFGLFDTAFAVRNIFDEDAREPSSSVIAGDYPLEGRQAWAEISYRF